MASPPEVPERRQLGLFAADAAPSAAPDAAPGLASALPAHPRANRELRLGGTPLRYELRRAPRRSIGFTVGAEGLVVSAPRWVAQADIETALRGKADWILRKLAEQAQRGEQLHAARIDWRDGAAFPFLGESLRLRLEPGRRGARLEAAAPDPAEPGAPQRRLHLGLPAGAGPAQVAAAVKAWLQRQARELFAERVAHFAPRLNVQCTRLALTSARTRWGSASASGSIRLHWRLVHFPLETIDYVVVHELAHLREMNHGPRFWALVESVMPDCAARRAALKASLPPPLE